MNAVKITHGYVTHPLWTASPRYRSWVATFSDDGRVVWESRGPFKVDWFPVGVKRGTIIEFGFDAFHGPTREPARLARSGRIPGIDTDESPSLNALTKKRLYMVVTKVTDDSIEGINVSRPECIPEDAPEGIPITTL